MNYLSCPGWSAGWDLGPVQLIVWGPESGKSVHEIHLSDEATSSSLQGGKATDGSLFKCHCKQVCWMDYAASHML